MRNKPIFIFFLIVIIGCSRNEKPVLQFSKKGRIVPEFLADSAYNFIQKQVDFGPRVPNTYGHSETKKYLANTLKRYAGANSVYSQEFQKEGYSGTLNMANIIAAFNLNATDRIMLCAHWDTRPRADEDTSRIAEYIPGADDGGSGVGVLLELARIFAENPPPIGVDIVLFDGEDYGLKDDLDKYFLGSRYWSQNLPVPGYKPRFGILLDMVGAEGAEFPKEEYSITYAPNLVNEIWEIAAEKGYGDLFLDKRGSAIQDDHFIINVNTEIPIIDIINHKKLKEGESVFPPHWHTHRDNMPIISKATLQSVGNVLTEFIYNRL